ncbi:hypothetical protein [Roseibium denhamense]|uniref:Uncharacterized protein n=1 Tax=Roseibium denhamense TaxID=76305 RepID=A0ABY1PE27_9HYPH|nr:hypothetical protein [Roseibium denhamense]SMP30872.1 hypothetical protein SAMN06265374_3347 [Roseibium denhamense]
MHFKIAFRRLPYLALASTFIFAIPGATASLADSCWNHNGSIMRLQAQGNQRWMSYENPRNVLRNAGVQRGTLLFNGVKTGNWYSGTARVFSKFCPGNPLEYFVEGPVRGDQLQVTVRGTREVFQRCQPTGRYTTDTLVFTYSHDC